MTKGQRIALQADWWPAACRAQGWKTSDRDLRLRVCAWAVSMENPTELSLLEAINSDRTPLRWLGSTNDLDNKSDIDAVKACLGMLALDLKQTGEVGQPQFGSARRKRDVIRSHLKCLALFEEHPRNYLASMVDDMFNRYRRAGEAALTIRDLTDDVQIYVDRKTRLPKEGPSQLERLVMRLAAVVNQKRNENVLTAAYRHLQGTEPLTLHEMKITAAVHCECSICLARRAAGLAPILPPLPVEENWSDLEPELEAASAADPELGNGSIENENPF